MVRIFQVREVVLEGWFGSLTQYPLLSRKAISYGCRFRGFLVLHVMKSVTIMGIRTTFPIPTSGASLADRKKFTTTDGI